MLLEDDVNIEAFADLVAKSEQNQAQENGNQKGFVFPTTLGVGSKAIVRFLNGLAESPNDLGKEGSGRAKIFNIAWVKDDNGKPFKLVLPAIIKNQPMYPHLLLEFIDKVLTRTWEEDRISEDGKKGGWRYFFAERDDYGQQQTGAMTLKQIFWNVYKSGESPSGQFYQSKKSWRGQTVYVANVIDRLDYEWHRTNKKTKLLMRKVAVKNNKISNYELSWYAVGSTMDDLTDAHGRRLNYDVLILPGAEAKDKFSMKNVSKLKEVGYWDDVKHVITEDDKAKISLNRDFTDEEKTWDPIDIGKYYRFTSSKTILKHFGKTIDAFDLMTGSNFLDRFKAEAAVEEKAAKGESKKEETPVQEPVKIEVKTQAPVEVSNITIQVNAAQDTTPFTEAPPEPQGISPETQQDISSFYDNL